LVCKKPTDESKENDPRLDASVNIIKDAEDLKRKDKKNYQKN
jgi:hypothetical protein